MRKDNLEGWERPFDFNGDGKLDSFERAVAYEEVFKDPSENDDAKSADDEEDDDFDEDEFDDGDFDE